MEDYVEYYNTNHLHFSLDINNYETPLMASHTKKTTDEIRYRVPNGWRVTFVTGGQDGARHDFRILQAEPPPIKL